MVTQGIVFQFLRWKGASDSLLNRIKHLAQCLPIRQHSINMIGSKTGTTKIIVIYPQLSDKGEHGLLIISMSLSVRIYSPEIQMLVKPTFS